MLRGIEEEAAYFCHPDHLGSVSVVSNHQGVPYERVEYLPFGEVWIEEVDPATGYIPFRFTSKELDRETGLYYYGARYYEPKVSRWMSADPAGFALVDPNRGGYSVIEAVNWYSYVSNNPVKYVDPSGLWIDNGDGTFTAEEGDTLYGLYGDDWREASGFGDRDPGSLQVGETVGSPSWPQARREYLRSQDRRVGPLSHFQDRARNNPRWQPRDGLTWCNQATFDIAEATGFNTEGLYEDRGRGWTLANQFIDNMIADLASEDSLLQEIGGEEAQMRADAGYTVIAAWANPNGHGHVATVRPGGEYSAAKGPTVSNVGSRNRYRTCV